MQHEHQQRMNDLIRTAIDAYDLIEGIHPAANIFPFMEEDAFNELVKDAEENGFLHPVRITDDGLVVDGRNRLCASIVIEKDVRLERYNPIDPIQYVVSENLQRRHLSSQQRAIIAVEAEELYRLFAEQAKQKQIEAIKERDELGRAIPVTQKIVEVEDSPKTPIIVIPSETNRSQRETTAKVAQNFGTNKDYVNKAQKVKQYAPELREKVKAGEVDLNDAAKIADQRKKEEKAAMQETPFTLETQTVNLKKGIETVNINGYTLHIWHDGAAKSSFNTGSNEAIDWAWSTWNPVTGCLHGCNYCYAAKIATNERMAGVYPKGFEPVFHPYRLDAPKNSRHFKEQEIILEAEKRKLDLDQAKKWAKNVFVCSMADLFGKWVPDEWIMQVFDSVIKYDDWNYLFLTKYPQRLQQICEKLGGSFPDNCWVGTTVDEQKRVRIAQDAFANIKAPVKWLSLEPLLTNLEFTDLGMFDMVAIGGQTNGKTVTFTPEWEWVENILWQARKSGTSVYFKENLLCRPKELPF